MIRDKFLNLENVNTTINLNTSNATSNLSDTTNTENSTLIHSKDVEPINFTTMVSVSEFEELIIL